jgi:hypothetical protein
MNVWPVSPDILDSLFWILIVQQIRIVNPPSMV